MSKAKTPTPEIPLRKVYNALLNSGLFSFTLHILYLLKQVVFL